MNFDENPCAHAQNSSTQIERSNFLGWTCPTKVRNVTFFLLCLSIIYFCDSFLGVKTEGFGDFLHE